jgi:hypothetical protein
MINKIIDNVFINKKNKKVYYSYKAISLNNIFFLYFIKVIYICFFISIIIPNIKNICSKSVQIFYNEINTNKSNINFSDEFFQIKSVINQIRTRNLTYIKTIGGGKAKIGNALIMLNNLINICEKIGCKNIITPGGLECLIKKPIYYKLYNITILPNLYKKIIKIDINLSVSDIYYFRYKKQPHKMRLRIIKDEIFDNIPKYNANKNDLFIHIRSGDIFINDFNKYYSQPPLCFYKKIINNFKFDNIYILSNGHENPVVDSLIKTYPKIKFINGPIEKDIAKIINAYNFVMSQSTFAKNLIIFNNNLKNLFVYELLSYTIYIKRNFTIFRMKPSIKYIQIMKLKWKRTKEQLNLMINENCYNSCLIPF